MGSVSGDSGHGSSHADAYDELFHTPSIADLDPLDSEQEETGNKVSLCWPGCQGHSIMCCFIN